MKKYQAKNSQVSNKKASLLPTPKSNKLVILDPGGYTGKGIKKALNTIKKGNDARQKKYESSKMGMKKMGGSSMPRYQGNNSQVTPKKPSSMDMPSKITPRKNVSSNMYPSKDDTMSRRDTTGSNFKMGANLKNSYSGNTYQKKKGGATMKKMGGITKSKKK